MKYTKLEIIKKPFVEAEAVKIEKERILEGNAVKAAFSSSFGEIRLSGEYYNNGVCIAHSMLLEEYDYYLVEDCQGVLVLVPVLKKKKKK